MDRNRRLLYVGIRIRKEQAETFVLFELISKRYERRSMLITANQSFAEWNKVFPDPSMTIAAVDRLVHHSVVVEMDVELQALTGEEKPD